jgi:RNA 2',3'-cyclic 3'-phosphodiesterase
VNKFPHYFIGIPVSEDLIPWLSEWQQALSLDVSYKTWVNPKDFHITLKFLGASSDDDITELNNRILDAFHIEEFQIHVGNLGFFGKASQPRVMWAGVEKSNSLESLYKVVEQASEGLFKSETRPYRPHVTLAKKWNDSAKHIDFQEVKEKIEEPGEMLMVVDRFHLYRIYPQREVKYEPVFTYKLK